VILLTLTQTYRLALISELAKLGVPPKLGALYSMAFTDSSDGRRYPGQLYSNEDTWLFVTDRDEARVLAITPNTPYGLVQKLLRSSRFMALDVGEIVRRVRAALALPPEPAAGWARPAVGRPVVADLAAPIHKNAARGDL
jgi:hypothetical protein